MYSLEIFQDGVSLGFGSTGSRSVQSTNAENRPMKPNMYTVFQKWHLFILTMTKSNVDRF